jgi:hypothetical protein
VAKACLLLRRRLHGRWDAFISGLARCGFELTDDPSQPKNGDVLVLWNRMPRYERHARRYEHNGGKVIIAENGWISPGPIAPTGAGKMIALCLGHHNGAGYWPVGDEDRWSTFGIPLKPWRVGGEHILVLAQRGVGENGIAAPRDWAQSMVSRLKRATGRPVVVRNHPASDRPDEPDFTNCWAAVTWSSGAGIKAIVAGCPVFHELPQWIGRSAAKIGIQDIEAPFLGDRLPMLRRLAWAQWTVEEIATGEPIRRLLSAQ